MSQIISLIKKELEKSDTTLVAFDGNTKIFEASGNGIKPILTFLRSNESNLEKFYGLSWGDKIVGKAAAFLFILLKPREVFGKLLSEAAVSIFTTFSVNFEYENKVSYILNTKKDDMCPFEKKVKDINDPVEAYQTILNFLNQLK